MHSFELVHSFERERERERESFRNNLHNVVSSQLVHSFVFGHLGPTVIKAINHDGTTTEFVFHALCGRTRLLLESESKNKSKRKLRHVARTHGRGKIHAQTGGGRDNGGTCSGVQASSRATDIAH